MLLGRKKLFKTQMTQKVYAKKVFPNLRMFKIQFQIVEPCLYFYFFPIK